MKNITNTKNAITLILLGDIAAGKGTQAKILKDKYNLSLIDIGAYSRRVMTGRSKIGKRLERIKLGKLAPSDIIKKYLHDRLQKLKKKEGVLIDGGKMPSEARLIYKILKEKGRIPLVIYLNIPKKEIYRRLQFRFYDKKTGAPLIIDPKKIVNGKYAGKEVIKRADDDPEAIKKRLDYYDKVYAKTVAFWKEKGLLRKISGTGSIVETTKKIEKEIRNTFGGRKIDKK